MPLIVHDAPVSVDRLFRLYYDVVTRRVAGDVDLVTVKVDTKEETVRVLERFENGTIRIEFPYSYHDAIFEDYTDVKREDWLTEDYCEYVVKRDPRVRDEKRFYIDILKEEDPANVGDPETCESAFLSQARRTKFRDLIFAARDYFATMEGSHGDMTKYFVWIDFVCANQGVLCFNNKKEYQKEHESHLSKGLHDRIAKSKHCLFFFDEWKTPMLLTRDWCLWELYGAIIHRNDRFDIVFSPEKKQEFTSNSEFRDVPRSIVKLDVAYAECRNEDDHDMIHRQVKERIGYKNLNGLLLDKLRGKLVNIARTHVLKNAQEDANALFSLANLLYHVGDFRDAMECCTKAIELFGKSQEAAKVYQTQICLAQCKQQIGEIKESLRVLEKNLSDENCKGIDRARSAHIRANIHVEMSQHLEQAKKDLLAAEEIYKDIAQHPHRYVGLNQDEYVYEFACNLADQARLEASLPDGDVHQVYLKYMNSPTLQFMSVEMGRIFEYRARELFRRSKPAIALDNLSVAKRLYLEKLGKTHWRFATVMQLCGEALVLIDGYDDDDEPEPAHDPPSDAKTILLRVRSMIKNVKPGKSDYHILISAKRDGYVAKVLAIRALREACTISAQQEYIPTYNSAIQTMAKAFHMLVDSQNDLAKLYDTRSRVFHAIDNQIRQQLETPTPQTDTIEQT